jgi:hypothetical protein
MKLLCFPHYTCGGLLCDILNNTFSPVGSNGGINSIAHSIGKIGDTSAIYDNFSPTEFESRIKSLNTSDWIGTHCWPGKLSLADYESVICVTTTTWPSKLYRWVRAYHHYYAPQWTQLSGMEHIDKVRETAKNYHVPFNPVIAYNVINIEFADIVENTQEFQHVVQNHSVHDHIERWRGLNSFLYQDVWNSLPAKSFYQAEVELNLQRYYRYE